MTDRIDDSPGSPATDSHDEPRRERTPEQARESDDLDRAPRSARASGGPSPARDDFDDDDLDHADSGRAGSARIDDANENVVRGRGGRDADTDDVDGDLAHDAGTQVAAHTHVNRRSTGLPPLTGPQAAVSGRRNEPSAAVGPFTVREVALLGVWAVAFLVSFFADNNVAGGARLLLGGTNVWLSGIWWIPAIALPTIAVGLIVLRRLSPQGIRRVGSLGIDQFASVAFSFAAFVWVAWVWDTVSIAAETGGWVRGWVVWVEAVLMVAGVVLTVGAPFIPPFSSDFVGRDDVPAHRLARPVRPVAPRPRRPRPARHSTPMAEAPTSGSSPSDGASPGSYTGSTEAPHSAVAEPPTSVFDTSDAGSGSGAAAGERGVTPSEAGPADHDPRPAHSAGAGAIAGDDHPTDVITTAHDAVHGAGSASSSATQAFWALAPVERDVVDDYGMPIFRIGPSAWALVIEDRGETFVIRHDDGRIGYLHDVSGVTRG